MRDLVNTCFRYLHDHSYRFFTDNFAGSLVKKVGRYERAYEDIAEHIVWNMFPAIFKISLVLVILFFVQPVLALVVLIWVILYWWFSVAFANYKLKYDIQNAELDTGVGGRLADTVTNNNTRLGNGLGI
jgi:ATP-binding cassette subfamily B protein